MSPARHYSLGLTGNDTIAGVSPPADVADPWPAKLMARLPTTIIVAQSPLEVNHTDSVPNCVGDFDYAS
jgi:hypothetical protein